MAYENRWMRWRRTTPTRTGGPAARDPGVKDLDRPLLRAAAQRRATAGLKTPDALQIAAALARGAGCSWPTSREA